MNKLERRFGKLAIPNITLYLMVGQIAVFAMIITQRLDPGSVLLVAARVLDGEWWRLVAFIFRPPDAHPIFLAFAWYLFYLMGTALEQNWGVFRYNLFLFIGWVATVMAAFLFPGQPTTNLFLAGSVFLAFAFLNPDFEIALFLVLPVKIKWLALVVWIFYGFAILFGDPATKVAVMAASANFALFFGKEIVTSLRARQRRMAFEAKRAAEEDEPFHRCHVCGITDKSHPQMQFRYCSKCEGHYGYCEEHITGHEHVEKSHGAKRGH